MQQACVRLCFQPMLQRVIGNLDKLSQYRIIAGDWGKPARTIRHRSCQGGKHRPSHEDRRMRLVCMVPPGTQQVMDLLPSFHIGKGMAAS